jgi:hypothetical protein
VHLNSRPLYGIIRGCPPKFFDGKRQAFTGLWFNNESEEFQFYVPLKMKDEPRLRAALE